MRFPGAEGAFPPRGIEEEVAALAVGCCRTHWWTLNDVCENLELRPHTGGSGEPCILDLEGTRQKCFCA